MRPFLLAALALALAAPAFAGMPEDEPLDATPEFRRALEQRPHHADGTAVQSALALVTPTPMWAPAEVTADGNVAVSGRPLAVVIVGDAPLAVIPERCRADAAVLPRGTTLLCFADDSRAKWVRGDHDDPNEIRAPMDLPKFTP